ncbi:hypothetical protein C8R44DRAFT_873747 [Mycena epipterygia]|nr:hypothetical protein C8R44DRAFT_873747 [Mycena epipterygia]
MAIARSENGIQHFRLSKAGAPFRHAKPATSKARRADVPDPSCATGGFYTAPTLASSYDALSPLIISWAPSLSCLLPAPSAVDIYLYAPGLASPRLHVWTGVLYVASILPRW